MSKPATTQRNQGRTRILFVIWILAIVVSGVLFFGLPQFSAVQGIAEVVEFKVAARDDAGILAIPIQAGDRVQAGQVIAMLDPAQVERQMDIVRAELGQQLAELDARRQGDDRRFEEAVDDAEADLLKAKVDREKNRAALEGTRARIRYWKPLVDSHAVRADDLRGLQADEIVLAGQDGALKRLAAAAEKRLGQARRRLAAYRASRGEGHEGEDTGGTAALQAAAAVSRAKLAELERQLDVLTLKAPSDGLVHKVLMRPGDVARKGETIVMLRSVKPERVFAYVTDVEAAMIGPGTAADLYPQDGSSRKFSGRVLSIGGMEPWPDQLHRGLRGQPWGQQVVLSIEDGARLVPGQVLDIEFRTSGEKVASAVLADAVAKTSPGAGGAGGGDDRGEPAACTVPAGLRAATRVEPSGIAWAPSLQRFLVVSDDTGLPDASDHAPYLLAMDANGTFDEATVPIRGVGQVTDLESIAVASDGSIWLLSSQDVSRKGRRNEARTLLIRARLDGRALVVSGSVSLSAALAAAGDDAWLADLGLSQRDDRLAKPGPGGFDRVLNVEGMAADGDALLLGLKRPLGPDGEAIVWRLSNPGRLVESGRLDRADLAVAARLPLRAGPDAGMAAGISDLFRLPDGRLVVLGLGLRKDAVTGGPDRIGALWIVATTGPGAWKPAKVREFPGIQAEGVAVGPVADRMTVVFDRKDLVPLWLELAVPK